MPASLVAEAPVPAEVQRGVGGKAREARRPTGTEDGKDQGGHGTARGRPVWPGKRRSSICLMRDSDLQVLGVSTHRSYLCAGWQSLRL